MSDELPARLIDVMTDEQLAIVIRVFITQSHPGDELDLDVIILRNVGRNTIKLTYVDGGVEYVHRRRVRR